MSSTPGRVARLPAVLLLACLTVVGLSGTIPSPTLRVPVAWCELLLPRLGADDAASSTALFDTPAPPEGRNLVAAAVEAGMERASLGRRPPSPYLGLVPLLLAGYALLSGQFGRRQAELSSASRRRAVMVRGAAGLALVGLALFATLPLAFAAVVWGLAAWGMAETCRPRAPDDDALPGLLLGAVSVTMTGLAAGLALSAGATPDRELLAPLLERLSASAQDAWPPSMLAVNAEHLRAVLDRSALAAFAGMAVLLLHLKARRTSTGLLLVAAIAADLLSAVPAP